VEPRVWDLSGECAVYKVLVEPYAVTAEMRLE
jgi:hypothetical protein